MTRLMVFAFLSSLLVASFGCAPSQRGDTFQRGQAQSAMRVHQGTILDVRSVTIEGTPGAMGGIAGGALGYAAGRGIGGGSGNRLARTGGAIGGALAGSAVERRTTQQAAWELTVEKDNGEILAIVQAKDDEFLVGDRVRILQSRDGTWRVRQ